MSNKQNTNTQKAKGKNSPKATGNSSPKSKKNKKASKPHNNGVAVAYANTLTSKGPKIMMMRTGLKSELVFTLPAASELAIFEVVKRLRINPLSRQTFKALPSIAQNFESFKFHKLRIRYETRVATSFSGSVLLSPSYDAADSDAQAATEALLYENKGTKDAAVWKSFSLDLSVAAMNRLYKSHTCMSDERFATTKQDLKTIDPAQVFIAIDAMNSTTTAPGKVFIDYDCEFFEHHAPTEPVNQGGGAFSLDTNIQTNSTLPISTTTLANGVTMESNPLIKTITELRNEGILDGTSASATIGQLKKDWSGIMDILTSGTNLNSVGSAGVYIGKDGSTASGSVNDVLMQRLFSTVHTTNPALTANRSSYFIEGLAGDFIKLATTTATTLASLDLQFGGTSAYNII